MQSTSSAPRLPFHQDRDPLGPLWTRCGAHLPREEHHVAAEHQLGVAMAEFGGCTEPPLRNCAVDWQIVAVDDTRGPALVVGASRRAVDPKLTLAPCSVAMPGSRRL
jgi:hypothetical protein